LFTALYEMLWKSSVCYWQFRWHLRPRKSAPPPPACGSRSSVRTAWSSVPSGAPEVLRPCVNPRRP